MPFDAALIGRDVAVTSHDKVVLAVEPLGKRMNRARDFLAGMEEKDDVSRLRLCGDSRADGSDHVLAERAYAAANG